MGNERSQSHRRVLIAELDSPIQRERYATGTSVANTSQEFVGMLRTAMLLAEEIVVTDSMLLDGEFFARTDPSELAALLGASPLQLPFAVLTRGKTLRDSLRDKLANESFVWQLRSSHLTREAIETHWDAWCAASETGAVRIEVITDSSTGLFIRGNIPDRFRTFPAAAVELAQRCLRLTRRSEVLNAVSEFRTAHPTLSAAADAIEQWWNRAYLDELARRNSADWMRFTPPTQTSVRRHSASGTIFHVAGSLRTRMESLTPASFGVTMTATEPYRRVFQDRPNRWRLRNLVFSAMHAIIAPNRATVLRNSVVKAVFAAVAIVFGLPNFHLDAPLGLDFAWFAFAIAALTTIPYADLVALVQLTRTRGAAELSIVKSEEWD